MHRSRERDFRWNALTLAFLFPFVGVLFVMLISQYEPFGQYSILYVPPVLSILCGIPKCAAQR